MNKILNKLNAMVCRTYCKLYLKRCKAGYKPTKEEIRRFCDCLYTILTLEA